MSRAPRALAAALLLCATPAAAQEQALRVGGTCGQSGVLVLERVQAERRSDGEFNYLLHIRNTSARQLVFTLSLRVDGREFARTTGQPYRIGGQSVVIVPTGPGPRPIPTATVAAGLTLNCPM
ncbi:hypothetical protein [Falsiroseomonas oryziterrae]|uniref:hypothetical protein n=1 Tax=Falsiroseomonas oryziterrae TaxID=2911368 RepID=UPI001F20E990|nr:hypothetical protein [Roseomonas sp. NPKOSM-4]